MLIATPVARVAFSVYAFDNLQGMKHLLELKRAGKLRTSVAGLDVARALDALKRAQARVDDASRRL